MKKNTLLITLLTLSTFVYSQNSKEETYEFFKQIQCRKIIENVFSSVKETIKTNEKSLFESQDLIYGNENDITSFHNFLDEEINLFIDDTYNEIFYKFSSKPKDSILKYISFFKEGENGNMILEKSGFKKELESIVTEKQAYLVSDTNLTLSEIRAKYQPLILKVIENGKESDISKIDLDLILNTKDEKNPKLSILNKSNSEIDLPENFNFELIESLTIKYLGKEYIVNRYNSMPKEIQELTSPLSKYCFEKLEKWTLLIDENNIVLETRGSVGQARK